MTGTVAVIGAGSWGTALAYLLAKKGNKVKLWVYLEEERKSLEENRENISFLPGVALSKNIEFSCDMEYCIKDTL